jgi:hypothetical protein
MSNLSRFLNEHVGNHLNNGKSQLENKWWCQYNKFDELQKFNWKIQKRLADECDGYVASWDIPYLDPNVLLTPFKKHE